MEPEWVVIGVVVAVGVGAFVLMAFYRKLSAIERQGKERRDDG